MRSYPCVAFALSVVCAVSRAESAPTLERCTSYHGDILKCENDLIYGMTVSTADDGTYTSLSWREYLDGDPRKWRSIGLETSSLSEAKAARTSGGCCSSGSSLGRN